ncbi:MAG: hypothetical protein ABIE25_04060 [Thermoplasmatota archaeon]|nr:hypothetical protein [Candidatus Thermoplasmatota archaeon]MBU1915287.1 hypothetical protein [Candidatus Thermoplasmatota archaeon]
MIPGKRDAIDRKHRAFIEDNYSPIPRDADEKIIDNIVSLAEMAMDKRYSLNAVLEQAAKLIFRHFDFREVGVGLKSRTSDIYKYEILLGYRPDIIDGFRKLRYTYEDMVNQDRYPNIKTGRLSELNPVEGLPEEEKTLFNRPYQLTVVRESLDDFHEGDYLDFWMYGPNKELIGWFELSNPIAGKLPPRRTIRWIELIVSICSSIVIQRWAEAGPPTR